MSVHALSPRASFANAGAFLTPSIAKPTPLQIAPATASRPLGAGKGALYSQAALPSFLYPAISGATAAERAVILETLDALPLKDVSTIGSIKMVPHIGNPYGGNGLVLGATRVLTGDMELSRFGNSLREVQGFAGPTGRFEPSDTVNPAMLRGTLAHEVGHGHDYQGGLVRMLTGGEESHGGPWGEPPHVSKYAETTAREDFAESYQRYHLDREQLRGTPSYDRPGLSAEKRAAMEESERLNFAERVVDNEMFRETGRKFGEITSAAPILRTGLALVGQLATLSLITGGVSRTFSGIANGNGHATVRGALDLGAGLGLGFAYANPLLGPAALALLGAKAGLDRADRDAAAPNSSHATPKVAAAAAVGGALGGVAGGVVGPLGGTALGYTVAGPIGGVVGLVVGSVSGFALGSALGAEAGIAIAS